MPRGPKSQPFEKKEEKKEEPVEEQNRRPTPSGERLGSHGGNTRTSSAGSFNKQPAPRTSSAGSFNKQGSSFGRQGSSFGRRRASGNDSTNASRLSFASRFSWSSEQADALNGELERSAFEYGVLFHENSFLLMHGWVVGAMLVEFREHFLSELEEGPQTVGDLCDALQRVSGPIALVLRAASILKLVEYDDDTDRYKLNEEGEELKAFRNIDQAVFSIVEKIYTECIPPFALDSREADYLFQTWENHRSLWRTEDDGAAVSFALLFDGAVLTPLLASIAFQERWDYDYGQPKGDKRIEKVDLKCDKHQRTIAQIMKDLGLGKVDVDWNADELDLKSSEAYHDWRKIDDFFVPTAHARFLREFKNIMAEGFVEQADDDEDGGTGAMSKLIRVGMPLQSKRYHGELVAQVRSLFQGDDFDKQPKYIVDDRSTDGTLLTLIHESIKSLRGDDFKKHPVHYYAVCETEEHHVSTMMTRMKHNVNVKPLRKDVSFSDPETITKNLQSSKVDLTRCLHVRAFADHTRTYKEPKRPITKGTAIEQFANTVLVETIHLDERGKRISAVNIFQSLVEHFDSWASECQGSAGICMVDVMQLSTPSIQEYMSDSAAFGTELLQSLGHQYVVPAVAFHMAAGMAGLFPPVSRLVSIWPKHKKYVRMIAQHVVPQTFKLRLAELSDIDRLMELEQKSWWDERLRAPREGIIRRLKTSPTTCFVMTVNDKVEAVLYMQRIESEDVIKEEKFQEVSQWHDPKGSIIQLIAINANEDPSISPLSLAQHLRAFALRFAELDPSIKSVCAVTICRKFKEQHDRRPGLTMEAYLEEHINDQSPVKDPIVNFHTGFGAEFRYLVHGYRPEDTDNQGIGVLIAYHLRSVLKFRPNSRVRAAVARRKQEQGSVKSAVLKIAAKFLNEEVAEDSMGLGLMDLGLESLELVDFRDRLSAEFAIHLPAAFLFEYSDLEAIIEELERMLCDDPTIDADNDYEEDPNLIDPDGGMSVSELEGYLYACMQEYKRSVNQSKFLELRSECNFDMMKYILKVEPLLIEIQKPILQSFRFLEGEGTEAVTTARKRITKAVRSFCKRSEQVEWLNKECTRAAKLYEQWNY